MIQTGTQESMDSQSTILSLFCRIEYGNATVTLSCSNNCELNSLHIEVTLDCPSICINNVHVVPWYQHTNNSIHTILVQYTLAYEIR